MSQEKTLKLLLEIQALTRAGLTYAKDDFDLERFAQIQDLTLELLAQKSEIKLTDAKAFFYNELGYPTPKIATRAAIFKDNKILMIYEKTDGLWAMPGGWCDFDQSIHENIVKEVKEEAGLDVIAQKIILISTNEIKLSGAFHNICRFFILCESLGGEFEANIEISEYGYFALDELPPLSPSRNTVDHIRLCFEARTAAVWETIFD